jgi:hypothetical protein
MDDRDQLLKAKDAEGVVAGGQGTLAGQTASPRRAAQAPTDLDPVGELRQERGVAEADEAEEAAGRRRLTRFGGPESEAVRRPVGDRVLVERA